MWLIEAQNTEPWLERIQGYSGLTNYMWIFNCMTHWLSTIVLLKGQVYKILIINHRIISHHLSAEATICLGFPDGASGKDFCLPVPEMQENVVIPGLRRSPGVENSTLLQIFLPGKFHGQRSLVGCSPWGCKESHMTECVHTHTHTICSGRKRH